MLSFEVFFLVKIALCDLTCCARYSLSCDRPNCNLVYSHYIINVNINIKVYYACT